MSTAFTDQSNHRGNIRGLGNDKSEYYWLSCKDYRKMYI